MKSLTFIILTSSVIFNLSLTNKVIAEDLGESMSPFLKSILDDFGNIKSELSQTTITGLERSCFACHGYNKPPANWKGELLEQFEEGKEELDFTNWSKFSKIKKRRVLRDSIKQVEKGKMPTKEFINAVPDAELTAEELQALKLDIGKL